jgi:pyruvate,water dikinase
MSKADYLENYGHRGPNEFELSVPRPAEDPSWLEGQLAQDHETPVDIQGLLAGQKATFDVAWERFQSRQPRLANAMRQRISESARRARLREHARSEYTRDRWLVRLFACRAGELSGIGDEVFFLTLDELLGLLSGKELACSIAARQETYRRLKELPPFPSIIQGAFDASQWASDPHRRSDIYVSTSEAIAASGSDESRIVRGSPGSAGQIEGFVRVIYAPEDAHLLQEGEILVTVQTDVAWTLIFPRAAAVVTDIGAPLSHAAIVARELGIPAVVGCGDATQRLKTGDRVRVDGGRGQVEKIRI